MLRSIKHPNILKTYGFFENFETIAIILEYCEGGDLARYINHRRNSVKINEQELEVRHIIKGILLGLNYIHNVCDSLHRDIKLRRPRYDTENIMIHCSLANSIRVEDVKIGDFGLSFMFTTPFSRHTKTRCGTKIYMSPEQLCGKSYGKVD